MITIKERKKIKAILKKCNSYSKSRMHMVEEIYSAVKDIKVEDLYDTLYARKNPIFFMDVKTTKAYLDLKKSSEEYSKFESEVLLKKNIFVNGEVSECTTVNFNECPFNVNCNMLLELLNVYESLKNGFRTNGNFENTVLIVLFNTLAFQYNEMKMDGIWSITERVEKIKAAEEKYKEKFFVNEYLYDTFSHPELFDSYGVYKSSKVFSMNKNNIIQDQL